MLCRSKRYPATWTSSAVQELFQMGSKSDQVPNATDSTTTDSQVLRPTTPPPNLSLAEKIGIAISVLVACGTLCAIATFSIRKKIRKKRTKRSKPSIISGELPITERPSELPASIEPAELFDRHEYHTELANSEIIELFQTSRQEGVELPSTPFT